MSSPQTNVLPGVGHCVGPFQLFSPTLPKFDFDANGIDQIHRQ
jgi:hypothetical protein